MSECKICNSDTKRIFQAQILRKYNVTYYQCGECQFIQTENEYWLVEAYSKAITSQDIGLVYRNIHYAGIVQAVIKLLFNRKGNFLDYGGGYGMFVRLMRDAGFQFFRFDTYCENIFSIGFEGQLQKYDLLTAFEVFEHLQDPEKELQIMLSKSRNILFSTELLPSTITGPEDWWYVMPETGQHIALYSRKSLQYLADKNKLNYYTNGKTLHLFTDKKINSFLFRIFTTKKISSLINIFFRNSESLLMTDYQKELKGN